MSEVDHKKIEEWMAFDNFEALGKQVQELMKMPQTLCKKRGNCCRVVTFKGNLNVEDIRQIAESDDEGAENASDFLTLFEPYQSQDDAREIAPMFVETARKSMKENPDTLTFFRCRFLGDGGECRIWEDRPSGCRMYPFPHEKTLYHPGCGFAKTGVENWKAVQSIIDFFERRQRELAQQSGGTTMASSDS